MIGGDGIDERLKGAAITQQTGVLFSVILVLVATPLILALAVGSEWDHVEHRSMPDDSTSLMYVGYDSCTPFAPTVAFVTNVAMSNKSLQVIPPSGYTNNLCGNPYEIQLDSELFNASSALGGNGSLSQFHHLAYGGAFLTAADCVGQWQYDFELAINGNVVVERNDFKNNACIELVGNSITNYQPYLVFMLDATIPFTIIESNSIRTEMEGCGQACNVTVTYGNVQAINFPASTNPHFPLDGYASHQLETYVADADENSFTVSLVNFSLSILYLLTAIASTPLWDPWQKAVMS